MTKFPRPEGHHTITPSFAVPNAGKVLALLESAFGAKVVDKYEGPGGTIMHCEVRLGDSAIMFGEPVPGMDVEAMPAMLSYYVDDAAAVDTTYAAALAAGATSVSEPKDHFYGHRSASVKDAGGNKWTITAIIEIVSDEEMQRRVQNMPKG